MHEATVADQPSSRALDLRPYVSAWALAWLDRDPDELHVQVDGTFVFTDLSGFTALSERLAGLGRVGGELMADHLDDVFSALLSDAQRLGGSLLHYGGDALGLLFADDDHARRGVSAAAAMRATLRRVGLRSTPFGPVRLRMSTGVATGSIDVFRSSGDSRMLLVSGSVSSEVLALEKVASSGEILIGRSLAALLPPSCVGEPKGDGMVLARAPRTAATTVPPPESAQDPRALLPASLVDGLLRGGAMPEHRSAAIAFVCFDGIAAAIADGSAPQRVDEFLSGADRICAEHNIALLQTDLSPDGGKLMIAAGAPVSHRDNEDQMLHAMRALVEADPGGWGLRAGITQGSVFAAGVGHPQRRTYTAIGDVVNTAARIMSRAPYRAVLAAESVLGRSRTLFDVTPIEPFAAKGKAELVRAVAVGEPVGTRVVDTDSVLVGRAEELARLARSLELTAAGAGSVVVLEAGPGVGKSRLLHEALSAVPREVRVLKVDCAAYRAGEPYATAGPLLAQALQLDGVTLEDRVRALAPQLLPWLPLLAVPLGLEVPETPEVRRLDRAAVVGRMHQTVIELLEAIFPGPVLLVVDDAQWADVASVELLSKIMTGGPRPWTAWVARRPTDVARVPGYVLQIGPLSDEAAIQVVKRHAPFPMLQAQAQAIVDRADGNPLFLRELARSARAGGTDALPADLEAVFASRIDALAAADRDLLKVCSVLGMRFPTDLPGALSPAASSRTVWDRLSEFIAVEDDGLSFRHAVAQQVAYAALPFSRRRTLHGRIGALLAAEPDPAPELLSLHFTEAGDWEQSWHWSREAGLQAGRIYALIETTRFYQRAVTAGRHAGVPEAEIRVIQWRLATAARHAGLTELAERTWHDLARSGPTDEVARALTRLSLLRSDVGDLAAGTRLARRALRRCEEVAGPTAEKSDAWGALAQAVWRRGEVVRVREYARRSLEACPEDEPVLRAETLCMMALTAHAAGEDGRPLLHEAIEVFGSVGDLRRAGNARGNLGTLEWTAGDWDAAEACWRQSLLEQEQAGYVIGIGWTAVNMGEIAMDRGLDAAAIDLISRAEEIAVAARDRALADNAAMNRATVLIRQLRLDDAEALLQTIHPGEPDLATAATQRSVELALHRTDTASALEALERLSTASVARPRLAAVAQAQRGGAALAAAELKRIGLDLEQTAFERGFALEALARIESDRELLDEAYSLLRSLGIVQITTLPVRADEQPARVRID